MWSNPYTGNDSDISPPRKRTFSEQPRKFKEESSPVKSRKKKKKKKVLPPPQTQPCPQLPLPPENSSKLYYLVPITRYLVQYHFDLFSPFSRRVQTPLPLTQTRSHKDRAGYRTLASSENSSLRWRSLLRKRKERRWARGLGLDFWNQLGQLDSHLNQRLGPIQSSKTLKWKIWIYHHWAWNDVQSLVVIGKTAVLGVTYIILFGT